jgi:hypothetical protein
MTANDFKMNSLQKQRRSPSRIFSNGAQFEMFSKQKTVVAIASDRIKPRAHRGKIILLFEYTTKNCYFVLTNSSQVSHHKARISEQLKLKCRESRAEFVSW